MNTSSILPLPSPYGLEEFAKAARRLLADALAGEAMTHIGRGYPNLPKIREWKLPASFTEAEAEAAIARAYGFGSADVFRVFLEGLARPDSPVSTFESAVERVIDGDLAAVSRLLEAHPQLIYGRSMRLHGATLLHYLGANGVEDYRQRSPSNAVTIAGMLLSAGADADAVMLDGTALGLVATSVHTYQAGVQIGLMETLVTAGASVEGVSGGWKPLKAALDNGRPEAAAWLAAHDAALDLATAAGVGRLDVVETLFEGSSDFMISAAAMNYAGAYGHTAVLRYLVEHGVAPGVQDGRHYTALHYAAHGGHLETVRYLLSADAPLELKNCYGGTVLEQTLWSAIHAPGGAHAEILSLLIGAGSVVRPGSLRWWLDQPAPEVTREPVARVLRNYFGGTLPRIDGPVYRTIPVTDLVASQAFYRDIMGFLISGDEALYGPARLAFGAPGEPVTVLFPVADLDAFWDRLFALGANPSTPGKVNRIKYRVFEVMDPDGNRLWFARTYDAEVPRSRPGQLRTVIPELPFSDVAAALVYYRDILGFSVNYSQEDLAVMERDRVTLLLIDRSTVHTGIGSCYFYVADVDALYDELTEKGAFTFSAPVTQPWGMRSFTVVDPEGNRVRFAQTFE